MELSMSTHRIRLFKEHMWPHGAVCLVPIFFESDTAIPRALRLKDCAVHQAQIERFSGACGQIMLCTQSHPRYLHPATLVFFGVGESKDFSLSAWEQTWPKALERVCNFATTKLILDLNTLAAELRANPAIDLCALAASTARAILAALFQPQDVHRDIERVDVCANWFDFLDCIELGYGLKVGEYEQEQLAPTR
jgi:hypothetical protein